MSPVFKIAVARLSFVGIGNYRYRPLFQKLARPNAMTDNGRWNDPGEK